MITKIYVDDDRVHVIAEKLHLVGLKPILLIEESDPQFKAVLKIVDNIRDKCIAFLLIVSNAIISYRLSSRGEEYWLEFAEYVSKTRIRDVSEVIDVLKTFLSINKGNRLLRSQKIRRLNRLLISGSLNQLLNLCRSNRINLMEVVNILANGLNSKKSSKTIVFACKMSYYFLRAIGQDVLPPFEIDIPVDRRIAIVSYTSGLIKLDPHISRARELEHILLRNSDLIVSVWRRVSAMSSIPPLNIDSLIWLISKDIGVKPISYVRKQALKSLSRVVDYTLAKSFLEELFRYEYTV